MCWTEQQAEMSVENILFKASFWIRMVGSIVTGVYWLWNIQLATLHGPSPFPTNSQSWSRDEKKPPCTEYQNPYIAKIRKCGVNWKLKNSTFLLRPEWIYPGLWVHVFKLGSIVFFLLFQGVQLLWGIGPQYPGLWVHVFKLCNFDGELALRGR